MAPAARDWAALPLDIVLYVFLRLGPLEVMLGAEHACKPWRRVALEEPTLWRRIGFDTLGFSDGRGRCFRYGNKIWRVAVDRANGQCEAVKGCCHNDDLLHLVRRAPSLKRLSIDHYINNKSGEDLVEALKKLTFLEDLEIDFRYSIDGDENMLQSVCKACPGLKRLVLMYADDQFDKEPVDGHIPVMRKLHILELYDGDFSCKGLKAILDNCPLLETLFIHGYFDQSKMDEDLKQKCAMVKYLTLYTRKKVCHGCCSTEEYNGGYSSEEYSEICSQEEDCDSEDE